MNNRQILAFTIVLAAAAGHQAVAAAPAAIVEDIEAPGATVQPFDFVSVGTRIPLGAGGSVVLGYLKSCLRETVVGGTVVVGDNQSAVEGGAIERERIECDGGNLRLSAEQQAKSGVTVFRDQPAADKPELRVFSVSPVFDLRRTGAAGELTIARLDRSDPPLRLTVAGPRYDMARGRHVLARGGLYRATLGAHTIVFRIDPYASEATPPLLSRLVQF